MIFRKNLGAYVETVIDGEAILLTIASGSFDALKDTGFAIWQAIDGARDLDAITALLVDRYEIDRATCAAEVTAFVGELERAGLIVAA